MIKNLTPHPLDLYLTTGEVLHIKPSSVVARVSTLPRSLIPAKLAIPVLVFPAPIYGTVEDLPPPEEGVAYIVSGMVLEALRGSGRSDVYAPGTGPNDGPIRNSQGQVVGVTTLIACG